ncbi:MAG: hypothetical protein JXR53_10950 [Bacteroidales bacterium]|nr:hypothetical protein [Bacteroidales bacterium]
MKNKIKFSIGSLFIAVMLMSFTTKSNAPLWVTHVDPFQFEIDFPNTPVRTMLGTGTSGIVHHVKLEQQTPGFPRFVLFFKEKNIPFVRAGIVADDMVTNYASSIGGTVSAKTTAGWKGGVAVTAQIISGTKYIHIRAFVLNNWSYLMIVEDTGKFPPIVGVNKFWNSLKPV